jgi:hypothetical protein
MKCKIDTLLQRITWTADTGESETLDMTKCSAAIVGVAPFGYAAYHGMKQRCGDTAALNADETTGKGQPDSVKIANVARMIAHYHTGTETWSLKVAGAPKRELTREEKVALMRKLRAELGDDLDLDMA